MHAIEKILARASGRTGVSTGEIVNCRVDLAEINDLYPQTIFSFQEMGGTKVHLSRANHIYPGPLCPGIQHPPG